MWTKSMFIPMFMFLISGMFLLNFNNFSYSMMLDVVIIEAPFSCFLILDKLSIKFSMMVSLISVSVFFYSKMYMLSVPSKTGFMISLTSFVISMFLLIFSGDLFWLMVGWDGLGLSSMLLIFFFQNWKSFNSGMVTFLSNRMGDFFLVSSLSVLFFSSNFLMNPQFMISLMILFGAFSKSAQIPFSSWLPLAMAAPTPVSALVHSSTLVTAGVYLLIRFNKIINSNIMFWACFISGVTLTLGGLSGVSEFDLKKIVALSTLSHIGLMMFFISMKSFEGATLHMMIHALFKSLLFMVSGCIIHDNNGEQDIRVISIMSSSVPLNISMMISILSMMGIPFFSGFYSKEFLLTFMSLQSEIIKLMIFMISIMMTCSYSGRLMFFLFSEKASKKISSSNESYWLLFSMTGIFSLVGGYMHWSLSSESSDEILFSYLKTSLLPLIFMGLLIGLTACFLKFNMKAYLFLFYMWGMSKKINIFQKLTPLSRYLMFYLDSKGVIDLIPNLIIKKLEIFSNFSLFILLSMSFFISSSALISIWGLGM